MAEGGARITPLGEIFNSENEQMQCSLFRFKSVFKRKPRGACNVHDLIIASLETPNYHSFAK